MRAAARASEGGREVGLRRGFHPAIRDRFDLAAARAWRLRPRRDPRSVNVTKIDPAARQELTPAARRALEEAALRRAQARPAAPEPPEQGGPSGPEPTRFGDWERKGRAVDF